MMVMEMQSLVKTDLKLLVAVVVVEDTPILQLVVLAVMVDLVSLLLLILCKY
jgi:hypothetical protein